MVTWHDVGFMLDGRICPPSNLLKVCVSDSQVLKTLVPCGAALVCCVHGILRHRGAGAGRGAELLAPTFVEAVANELCRAGASGATWTGAAMGGGGGGGGLDDAAGPNQSVGSKRAHNLILLVAAL